MNSFCFTLLLLSMAWTKLCCQIVLNVSDKRGSKHASKKEDYTFEAKLKRATEECSYIARKDDESDRREAMQRIKNEMNNRNAKEFYKEKEEEKKRGKEYYEKIERQVRNKVLIGGNSDFSIGKPGNGGGRTRKGGRAHPPTPRWRSVPAMPPPSGKGLPAPDSDPFHHLPATSVFGGHFAVPYYEGIHRIFKRSRRTKPRDPSFQEGKFKDHNNCFSRCVFARMELVDSLGFPQESILRKVYEDLIDNRKIRRAKIKRTFFCFDEVKKVAIDDNCIYSNKIFKCLGLGESHS